MQQQQLAEAAWLERKHSFEAMAAGENTSNTVDISHISSLCIEGIPDQPSQLRPMLYSLLLGTLPLDQSKWKAVKRQQRRDYYALVDKCKAGEQVSRIQADVQRHDTQYPILKRRSRPRRSSRLYPTGTTDTDSDSSLSTSTAPSNRRAIFQHSSEDTPSITLSATSEDVSTILSTSDAPTQADTHTEVITRVLAVLSTNIAYDPVFVSALIPMYLIYAQAPEMPRTFAEEEVYWAFLSLLNRTSAIRKDMSCLETLGRRLKWVDEHLHSILLENDVDPSSPLYTFRWMNGIFAADIENVIPLWDALFSAPDLVEAITDMSCAILLASKKHLFRSQEKKGLWGGAEEEDASASFVRSLTFLRNIPIHQIGGSDSILGAYAAIREAVPQPTFVQSPKSEIGSRLASLTLSVGARKLPPSHIGLPAPPKALRLQEKARRASNPASSPLQRSSSGSHDGTLSPPSSGLYRIGSRQEMPRRALVYDHTIALMVGLGRRPRISNLAPLVAAVRRYSNYPDHLPLGRAQKSLLAVGSGLMGVADTRRGDLVATLSESTASTFLPALHSATVAHPEGRQIMRDRPVVSTKTIDLDHLRGLQRGTLGREYVEWLGEHGLTPDTREKVRYIDSPTLAYAMLRYRQTHDLYHTLFTLPPTLPHELSLKVVELSNMSLPVAGLSSAFGPFRLTNSRRGVWLNDWAPWALRVGREGKSLVGVYWEKRWEQGLGDLRRELGVYRNDLPGVESRWRGYRELRERERELRRNGNWVDEPEFW